MFCSQLPKIHGNIEGDVYITKTCPWVAVPANNMRDLRYIIVIMRAVTGSRLVRQLLHTGHYGAPPKRYKAEDRSRHSCSFFDDTQVETQ